MPNPTRQSQFRTAIENFLAERRDAKLEKLKPDDPKRQAITEQFQRELWLADAARRVAQIQAVTHTLKPIHPDARGTNLFVPPDSLPSHPLVGSHCLDQSLATDVVGNAAALDVHKFLKIEVEGRTLLDGLLQNDDDLLQAFTDQPELAASWAIAFKGLIEPRGETSTHSRAKQIYWLVGDDPSDDSHFHLLAPLYASSLAHRVFKEINETRFGEAAKQSRTAKKAGVDHPHGHAEYVGLASQKLGGTKPQNISQLNSERGGNNYLLSSLPPVWQSAGLMPPWHVDSVFPRFGKRRDVRNLVRELKRFLQTHPAPNEHTRQYRDRLIDQLIDELHCYALELQEQLTPAWSAKPACQLPEYERLWLDPLRAVDDTQFRAQWMAADWTVQIGDRFGLWLNEQFKDTKLAMSDVEQGHWRKTLISDHIWRQIAAQQKFNIKQHTNVAKGGAA